ncbi:MAG: hypothetical protein AAFV95_10180 [Bacteroidota bacterium]
MNPMAKYIAVVIYLIFTLIGCTCNGPSTVSFESLDQLDTSTFENGDSFRMEHYIVDNILDQEDAEAQIDEFICQNKVSDPFKYHTYVIYIFRKSRKTNWEYISQNPKSFDRYSMTRDRIFDYIWTRTGTQMRYRFKGQEMISSRKINCENIPSSRPE